MSCRMLKCRLLKCPGKYHFVICCYWPGTCYVFAHSFRLPVCGGGYCSCINIPMGGGFFFNKVTGNWGKKSVMQAKNLNIFVNYQPFQIPRHIF